ncbi:MAG: ABC transporter permease [Thermomicrobiales bacterium]|nr:ABC transporter permease [Thermomicrobiales bacterium]MCO5217544.1 ABC transporter permease [Thermomicrobiales bacterium]MCO5226477.1 ABC transporter permease [Thermomicrobiales bacterium]MCO5226983.1 ABC transporter permease [Thermomicrobiales bacterium]
MDHFFTLDLLTRILRMSTPLIFAALGGLICERSGVINIALEGLMLIGAFFAVAGTYWTGSPWLGLIIGVLCAMAGAMIHAVWSISIRGDQIVVGTAVNLIALGLTAFLVQSIWGTAGGSDRVTSLPKLGGMSILVPVAFVFVPIVAFVLFRTKQGLRLQACGEHPQASVSAGIDITRYRYSAVLTSGLLAGLGGAYLSIGNLNYFTLDMTNGRGFIALAAVILGGWNPWGALAAALLFGAAEGIQIQGQSTPGFPISSDLLVTLPYIVTLIAITLFVKARSGPAGLGKHATTS